ncbi:hypothetical protein JMUB7533_26860 [Staphylococcus aureus]
MEDVTDIVFRHVVSEAARPDVFFTEFTNTESFCHPEGIHSAVSYTHLTLPTKLEV